MSEIADVWYQLYGRDGKPYLEARPAIVSVKAGYVVAQLKDAIHDKNKNRLAKVDAAELKVYQRQGNQGTSSALENVDLSNLELLEVDRLVGGLGDCKANSLVVVVPKGNLKLTSL